MSKKTINDLNLKGKKVLMRVDFNVPLNQDKVITDDNRIVQALPSIKKVIEDGGKLILMSHLGRPKGKKNADFSLAPVAKKLSEKLGKEVAFLNDCIGEEVEAKVNQMDDGQVVLLENLRFYKEETDNDSEFAKKLASLADLYINDAFGTSHRAHASTEGVTHHIKESAIGFLIEKELKFLGMAIEKPQRPYLAIIGGAKVSGKIDVINNLMDKVDALIIGGGMMFTFYKAMGLEIGKSLLEEDKVEVAKEVIEAAKAKGTKLLLPPDVLVADKFDNDAKTDIVSKDNIPNDTLGMDIGPESIKQFSDEIKNSKTIVWNGPMGVFEMENFAKGTMDLAKAIADVTQNNNAVSIIGGGDSAAAIAKANLKEQMSHISTGGGASLEFLEGKKLPGIEAVDNV